MPDILWKETACIKHTYAEDVDIDFTSSQKNDNLYTKPILRYNIKQRKYDGGINGEK